MDVRIELYPVDSDRVMIPVLVDKVTWKSSRDATPSQLTYTVKKDANINFALGTRTALKVKGHLVWVGYTMYKHRTSESTIQCTAYDQLRYLKMKTTQSFENLNAGEIIKNLLDQNGLEVGTIDNIKDYKQTYVAEDKEILEVIEYVSQMHTAATDEVMIFYDNKGKLCWQNIENMKVNGQIYSTVDMQDFDYTSSIENSYNSVYVDWLDAEGKATGKVISVEDSNHIKYWGLLRYHDKSNEGIELVKQKANILLDQLNRETRKLELKKVLGNSNIRGGCIIPVRMSLGDMVLGGADSAVWMIVKSVTHTIDTSGYWMDITCENQALGFADPVSPDGVFEVNKQTSSSGSGSGTHLPGNNNIEKIWNALMDLGFSEASRAGILGNMYAEVGDPPYNFSPTSIQNNGAGPGHGLCQWEDSGGSGRWVTLVAWCHEQGLDEWSIEGQCAFLNHELLSTGSGSIGALFKHYTGMTGQTFKGLGDVHQATEAFLRGFEIPGGGIEAQMNKRYPKAQQYYEQYHGYGEQFAVSNSGQYAANVKIGKQSAGLAWPLPNNTYVRQLIYGGHTHNARDLGVPVGSLLVACANGVVAQVQYWDGYTRTGMQSYGDTVLIQGESGLQFRFAHMSRIDVKVGQQVAIGQPVGLSGNTGNSSGPHVHFELCVGGVWQDPSGYFPEFGWQESL